MNVEQDFDGVCRQLVSVSAGCQRLMASDNEDDRKAASWIFDLVEIAHKRASRRLTAIRKRT